MVQWNNVLAYTTPKLVKIRDWKLGALNYIFQFAIFAYILFEILYSKGYMKMEQITGGVVTANANSPVGEFKDNNAALGYCCDDCDPWYEPPDKAGNMTCLFWDGYQADYPASVNNQIVMTSRIRITRQIASAAGCTSTNWTDACEYEADPNTAGPSGVVTAAYVANLEQFTIMIRHGVHGMSVSTQGASTGPTSIGGTLVKTHGEQTLFSSPEILKSWPNNTAFDIGNGIVRPQDGTRPGDIMRLQDILDAVGVSLEDKSEAGESYRFAGINIVMYISYRMLQLDFTGDKIEYVYEPRLLSDLEYKIEQEKPSEDGTSREIYNRHAVRIIFVQTGMVGKPDSQALLLTLVTGLGLLAVSSTIVTFLMTYVLRLRMYYTWYRYDVTEDIGHVDADDDKERRLTLMQNHLEEGKGHFWAIDHAVTRSKIYEDQEETEPLITNEIGKSKPSPAPIGEAWKNQTSFSRPHQSDFAKKTNI